MLLEEFIKKNTELQEILSSMPKNIKERCYVKKFRKKNLILKKDENVKFVYIICEGEAKGVNEFANGNLYVVEKITPFAFIGELSVVAEKLKASVTIEASTDCTTIQISREDFCKWLEKDHIITMTVVRGIAKKYYQFAYNKGIQHFYPSLYMLQLFIIRQVRAKIENNEYVIINERRQQIADEMGVNIKTVNRGIKKLKDDNLISIYRGKLYVNRNQYLKIINILEEWDRG